MESIEELGEFTKEIHEAILAEICEKISKGFSGQRCGDIS